MSTVPNAQVLADWYSRSGGYQILLCVYEREAIFYAQVSESTAKLLAEDFCMEMPHVAHSESPALSRDGLTYCWIFERCRLTPGEGDWLPLIVHSIRDVLVSRAADLLESDEGLMVKDNRGRDHNTVKAFADLVRNL